MVQTQAGRPAQSSSSTAAKGPPPIFFYMPYDSPCGVFCQWHLSPFVVTERSLSYLNPNLANADSQETISFNCTEQYMMYCKSVFFHDTHTSYRILATDDPKEQKKLGKQVAGFWDERWAEVREQVGEGGNWAKFTEPENVHMKKTLLDTGDRLLCEASSKDMVWGIGYKEKETKPMWLAGRTEGWGLNLLGKALMRVRQRLEKLERPGDENDGV